MQWGAVFSQWLRVFSRYFPTMQQLRHFHLLSDLYLRNLFNWSIPLRLLWHKLWFLHLLHQCRLRTLLYRRWRDEQQLPNVFVHVVPYGSDQLRMRWHVGGIMCRCAHVSHILRRLFDFCVQLRLLLLRVGKLCCLDCQRRFPERVVCCWWMHTWWVLAVQHLLLLREWVLSTDCPANVCSASPALPCQQVQQLWKR